MREQVLALIQGRQPERRNVGLEECDRMWVEGRDDHRTPLVKGALDRPVHHRLVAEMETVEIAERDDASPQSLGDAAGEGQPLHEAAPYPRFARAANQWVGRCFRNSRYSWTARKMTKRSKMLSRMRAMSWVKL